MIYGWQRYQSIENDFLTAKYYVSLNIKEAYSEFITREVILLGTEIEAAFKELCRRTDGSNPGNLAQYKKTLLSAFPRIVDAYVMNRETNEIQKPFANWDKGELEWWNVYTGIKHSRIDTSANLGIALTMLQAYELLLFLISAKEGNFYIEYYDAPRLFIPDLDAISSPSINVFHDMRFYMSYNGRRILLEVE